MSNVRNLLVFFGLAMFTVSCDVYMPSVDTEWDYEVEENDDDDDEQEAQSFLQDVASKEVLITIVKKSDGTQYTAEGTKAYEYLACFSLDGKTLTTDMGVYYLEEICDESTITYYNAEFGYIVVQIDMDVDCVTSMECNDVVNLVDVGISSVVDDECSIKAAAAIEAACAEQEAYDDEVAVIAKEIVALEQMIYDIYVNSGNDPDDVNAPQVRNATDEDVIAEAQMRLDVFIPTDFASQDEYQFIESDYIMNYVLVPSGTGNAPS